MLVSDACAKIVSGIDNLQNMDELILLMAQYSADYECNVVTMVQNNA